MEPAPRHLDLSLQPPDGTADVCGSSPAVVLCCGGPSCLLQAAKVRGQQGLPGGVCARPMDQVPLEEEGAQPQGAT